MKIRKAAGLTVVEEEGGASPALDALAAAGPARQAFLRAIWFAAAAPALSTLVGRRPDGTPIAAIPLAPRRMGPLTVREVPGSYWPFRGFALASDAADEELAALFASPALGSAWRLGPIHTDDPGGARLVRLAGMCGWTVLTRRLSTSFRIDLKGLAADGPWPSVKTLRKNRWLERRLAEAGELEFRSISGDEWNTDVFDALAAIEGESWVGDRAGAHDTKFLDPANRRVWERITADPPLAAMLSCSLLYVGGVPAAFTFFLRCGGTRCYLANSYSKRFAERSPGRILLYRDFQEAAEAGVGTIDWGAGDPGYKSEMGAKPGPDLVDHLFVRGRTLAKLARLFWERGG